MKHMKTFEGFLDFFKKSDIDKELLSILERLKKVQKLKNNPYKINRISQPASREITDIFDWILFDEREVGNRIYDFDMYEVIFDDITIVAVKYSSVMNNFDMLNHRYTIFIKETDSESTKVKPTTDVNKSIVKDIWKSLNDIFFKQSQYGETDRIKSIINKSADLL